MSTQTISAQELADSYRRGGVVVIDCRFALTDIGLGERQYAEAHIPGAIYFHLDRDLSGTNLSCAKGVHGGRHPLPDISVLVEKLSAAGINSAPPTLVVAYDDSRFGFAARLWWLLRYLGHDNVKVLDGGFAAWRAAGLPVTDAMSAVRTGQSGHFVPRVRVEWVLDNAAVKTLAPEVALIDSREPRRYLGLEEPIDPIAGHIPGAQNFPWQQASDAAGVLLSEAAQKQRWGDVATAKDIVVYCGSGVTACVNLLALAEIGRDDAKLYAGSWSDWCSYLN